MTEQKTFDDEQVVQWLLEVSDDAVPGAAVRAKQFDLFEELIRDDDPPSVRMTISEMGELTPADTRKAIRAVFYLMIRNSEIEPSQYATKFRELNECLGDLGYSASEMRTKSEATIRKTLEVPNLSRSDLDGLRLATMALLADAQSAEDDLLEEKVKRLSRLLTTIHRRMR